MYFLIIAVLGLLVLTKFYKMDQVKNVLALQLAWTCMIASVAFSAAGQLIMLMVDCKGDIALLTNVAILIALAVSLHLWNKAVTVDDKKDQDNA